MLCFRIKNFSLAMTLESRKRNQYETGGKITRGVVISLFLVERAEKLADKKFPLKTSCIFVCNSFSLLFFSKRAKTKIMLKKKNPLWIFLFTIDHFIESFLRVRLYIEKSVGATLLSATFCYRRGHMSLSRIIFKSLTYLLRCAGHARGLRLSILFFLFKIRHSAINVAK